jgi:hypothetical protein
MKLKLVGVLSAVLLLFLSSTRSTPIGAQELDSPPLTDSTAKHEAPLADFHFQQVLFDESVQKKADPRIPREWRFVGISRGYRPNLSNLWFQGQDGRIYLVQGFENPNGGEFTLLETVYAIAPK